MPAKPSDAIEQAEFEEVANTKIGERANVWRKLVIGVLLGSFLTCRPFAGKIRPRFALGINPMLLTDA